MNEEDAKAFYNSLKKGPAFLFLGQCYLRDNKGEDIFLDSILKKYGITNNDSRGYSSIFNAKISESHDDSLSWMHNLSQRLSPPTTLEKIAQYNWSGIFTSAIDDLIIRTFRTEWREIDPIYNRDRNPDDPRNRVKLHCTFLFGNVNRTETDEEPPLIIRDLKLRNPVAIQLLARLPSQITPMGILVIESYDPSSDWLKIDDFFPVFHECIRNRIQVFIFSATDELINNEDINEINKKGTIKFFRNSLYEQFILGERENAIDLQGIPDEESTNRYIELKHKTLMIPSKLWNRVIESATIIDDSKLVLPPQLSPEKLYQEFRSFISNAGTQLDWSGFLQGFAFDREYEEQLLALVQTDLNLKQIPDEPIILSGQTGTGKSVALKHLAIKIRKEKIVPVLFIERRTQLPKWEDIDIFCQWAEEYNKQSTVIIWDGMLSVDNYEDFLKYLTGRGRKVLLIGSCYRLADEIEQKTIRVIQAPATLNDSEVKRFLPYIERFDPLFVLNIKSKESLLQEESFLVALYRLLPISRSNIRVGIQREVSVSESIIKNISITNLKQSKYTLLGYSLQNNDEKLSHFIKELNEEKVIGGENVNPIEYLIGLIMTPGKFGIDVPLDLLYRTLNKFGYIELYDILAQVDIFRCYEDSVGNLFVGPRHPLEAKIICQQRLGGARSEIEYAVELIDKIQSEDATTGDSETIFVRDLVHQLGPNGPENYQYLDYYPDLIASLSKLRKERQILNPKLILQEAFLSREFVKQKSTRQSTPRNAEKILLNAKQLLISTLQNIRNENRSKNYQLNLLVELAAINGTLANHTIQNSIQGYDYQTLYTNIRDDLNKVLIVIANDEHALDVFSWVSLDLISKGVFDPIKKIEVISDVLSAIDNAESGGFDITPKILARKFEIFQLIGEDLLADDVFNKLKSQNSCAGYYLRALNPIRNIPNDREYTSTERELFKKSFSFLEENREIIKNDERCLRLLLYCWWKYRVGKPLFFGERQVLDYQPQEWVYLRKILQDLNNLGKLENNPSLLYIYGITCFHLKEIIESKRIFSDIDRTTSGIRGIRRIVKSYLASNSDGSPKIYHGDVHRIDDDKNIGEIYVQELRTTIKFIPKDFHLPQIKKGDNPGEFHIGFNFINPIADPIPFKQM